MQELDTTQPSTIFNGTQPATPTPAAAPAWQEDADEEAMRAALFASGFDDRPEVLVPVPEWNRQVLIRAISGTQRAAFITWQRDQDSKNDPSYNKRLSFYIVSNFCLHPKSRKPFLKPADQQAFMDERNGAVIETLSYTVIEFCHLDGSTTEQAKKNLGMGKPTATTN